MSGIDGLHGDKGPVVRNRFFFSIFLIFIRVKILQLISSFCVFVLNRVKEEWLVLQGHQA